MATVTWRKQEPCCWIELTPRAAFDELGEPAPAVRALLDSPDRGALTAQTADLEQNGSLRPAR